MDNVYFQVVRVFPGRKSFMEKSGANAGGNSLENDGFQRNSVEIRRKNARKINAVKIGGFRLSLRLMVNE
jgi:hypothetical protein